MYSCLILFWSKTCEHYNPSMKVSCPYRLHALATLNALTIVALLLLPFLSVFLPNFFPYTLNMILVVCSIILLLLFLVEATNVYKFLGSSPTETSAAQHETTIAKMKMTTKLIITCSGCVLFLIVFISISSAIRVFVRFLSLSFF